MEIAYRNWLKVYLGSGLGLDCPILEAINEIIFKNIPLGPRELKKSITKFCIENGYKESCGFLSNRKINIRTFTHGSSKSMLTCITSSHQDMKWYTNDTDTWSMEYRTTCDRLYLFEMDYKTWFMLLKLHILGLLRIIETCENEMMIVYPSI